MTWLLIILAILLLLLITLLFAPISVFIDTDRRVCRLNWAHVVSGYVLDSEADITIRLSVFGFKWDWSLLRLIATGDRKGSEEPAKVKKRPKRKRRVKVSGRKMLRKAPRLLRSFRIRTFYLDIDTDNFATNAWLYPVFGLLRHRGLNANINFQGGNTLKLYVQNSPVRMLMAWLF